MRNRLTYFPQIYPGELIYSTIARYGYHTGCRMAHKLNAELFGRKGPMTSFDLPTNLDNLCAILPEIRSIKSCDIINNNTLYRYHTAFVKNDYRERVARAMSQSQTVGKKATVRRQSAANALSRLRFCKECHAEMQEKHNEYYWRSEHQLPLSLICHSHGSVLYESTVAVGRGLQNYEIPTNLNCVANDATAVMPPDRELHAIVQRITAESIRHLTATKPQEIFEFEPSFYTTKLQDLGLLIGNKYSNFDLIRSKARQHFGSLIKIRPDMDLSDLNRDSWLMLPTRQLSSNAHPLYHILLRDFLENQPIHNISDGGSKFWRSNIDTWPCYNPIINHKTNQRFLLPIITHSNLIPALDLSVNVAIHIPSNVQITESLVFLRLANSDNLCCPFYKKPPR